MGMETYQCTISRTSQHFICNEISKEIILIGRKIEGWKLIVLSGTLKGVFRRLKGFLMVPNICIGVCPLAWEP